MNTALRCATGFALALAACNTPSSTEPTARPARAPLGQFVIDVDGAKGTATVRAIHEQRPIIQDGLTGNPTPGAWELVTTLARLPNQGGCPAGNNCFSLVANSGETVPRNDVVIRIDSITPATGRALVAPDAAPFGLDPGLGIRNVGDVPANGSAGFDLVFAIPDTASYSVTGSLWAEADVETQGDGLVARNNTDGCPGIFITTPPFAQSGPLVEWAFFSTGGGSRLTPLVMEDQGGNIWRIVGIGQTAFNTFGGVQRQAFNLQSGDATINPSRRFAVAHGDNTTSHGGVAPFDNGGGTLIWVQGCGGTTGLLTVGNDLAVAGFFSRTYSIEATIAL